MMVKTKKTKKIEHFLKKYYTEQKRKSKVFTSFGRAQW
jgi:hypothetical protein